MKAKKWISKVRVVGSTGNIYTVAKDANGKYACSCPAWIYQRAAGKIASTLNRSCS